MTSIILAVLAIALCAALVVGLVLFCVALVVGVAAAAWKGEREY